MLDEGRILFFRSKCKEKRGLIFWNRAHKQAIVKKDVYEKLRRLRTQKYFLNE